MPPWQHNETDTKELPFVLLLHDRWELLLKWSWQSLPISPILGESTHQLPPWAEKKHVKVNRHKRGLKQHYWIRQRGWCDGAFTSRSKLGWYRPRVDRQTRRRSDEGSFSLTAQTETTRGKRERDGRHAALCHMWRGPEQVSYQARTL